MGRRPSRRAVLYGLGTGGLGLAGLRLSIPWFLRAGDIEPVTDLSPAAQALVARAFADVDREKLWDLHAHVVGLGAGGTGCSVNPAMRSHLHPIQRLQFEIYFAAAGIRDEEHADQQYVERLLALHRAANPKGKLVLLAFDRHIDAEGNEDLEATPFHTPNDYVLGLAKRHPDVAACVSIHPYRADALERLEKAAAAGAVAIKWLPNAMGIDPASPRCDPFYERLAALSLPLLTHTGLEKAVHAEEAQELGNPLRLRRALGAGVTVLAAHCASTGSSKDLDAKGAEAEEMESFDLFLRLMGEKQYEGQLYGEISTLTQVNRCGRPLREVLLATELHPRLVNGSDYPLPAIDPLYSTRLLARREYIDAEDRRLLNEVFEANPLLFDYVLKRRVGVEAGGRVHRFAPVVFESGRLFGG